MAPAGQRSWSGLGERDSDLSDRDIIQNVGERDTGHGRNDQNHVHVRARVKRRIDFAKREGEGKKQRGSDEADQTKTADRP